MKIEPRSIVKGKREDLPSILSFYHEVAEALLEEGNPMWSGDYPGEEDFLADIENDCLYLLKEGKKILGCASVTHDASEVFFPQTHSYRKSDDLLEKIGYRGEPLCILHRFAISPDHQRKGLGSEFFRSLSARYKGSTWVFAVYEKNVHALSFYQKLGFHNLGLYPGLEYGEYSSQYIVYKAYKKDGLCSNAWW